MGRPSRYPEEFRREAVQLVLSSDDSRAAVARRLRVNETTLRNWVAAQLAEGACQADPSAVTASEFEELRRLRKENAELRTEREILRKAAAYFAQETIRSAADEARRAVLERRAGSCGELIEFPRGGRAHAARGHRRAETQR
jgi:transposase